MVYALHSNWKALVQSEQEHVPPLTCADLLEINSCKHFRRLTTTGLVEAITSRMSKVMVFLSNLRRLWRHRGNRPSSKKRLYGATVSYILACVFGSRPLHDFTHVTTDLSEALLESCEIASETMTRRVVKCSLLAVLPLTEIITVHRPRWLGPVLHVCPSSTFSYSSCAC